VAGENYIKAGIYSRQQQHNVATCNTPTYKHKREQLLTLKYSYVEIVLEIPEIGFTLFFVCYIFGLLAVAI